MELKLVKQVFVLVSDPETWEDYRVWPNGHVEMWVDNGYDYEWSSLDGLDERALRARGAAEPLLKEYK